MAAIEDTSGPGSPVHSAYPPFVEAAWLYQADQVCPEDLPMTAALALAVGMDTPALCELAGLSRHADPRDIRDTFEQALEELGMILPSRHLARRFALRRLAARFTAGEVDLAELASDEWSEMQVETVEEQGFLALLPPCSCCIEYTVGLEKTAWEAQLQIAACALVAHPTVGPRL
ncbi:hypothetical protein ACIPW5_39115 [Streptomyces sp. NPDC090077]|uniref:hypothetical protein n=1 Tax=Streptomyces sp. NPDC090077 TaxID=3365938 RepID=UPI0037FC2D73